MQLYVKNKRSGYRLATLEERITSARKGLNHKFRRGTQIKKPKDTEDYLTMRLAGLEHEVFCLMWLDNRHRVIVFEEMFRGTIDGASVHAREIVKSALKHNAAACILAHCHPSGIAETSSADERITEKIAKALRLIDVRVLDHCVVAAYNCVSFAARGLL